MGGGLLVWFWLVVLAEEVKGVFEEEGYDKGSGGETLDLQVVGEEGEGRDGGCLGGGKG